MNSLSDRLTTLLDQQLFQGLTEAENQELTQLLTTKEGKQTQAEYHVIRQGLITAGRESMKATLSSWEQDSGNASPYLKIKQFPLWGSLLAVAAAITVLVLIFRPSGIDLHNQLAMELSQPYPNFLLPVERGSQAETTLQKAFTAYEAGQYSEAIILWNEADTASLDLDFYRANALHAQNMTAQALELFAAIADSESQFAEQAEWYQAMLLWQEGQKTEAEEIISKIAADEGHEMWKRAQRWE